MLGSVVAVNADGTVSVSTGPGEPMLNVPCDPAYNPRAKGDRVVLDMSRGQARVTGKSSGSLADVAPGYDVVDVVDPGTALPPGYLAADAFVNPATRSIILVTQVAAPAPVTGTEVRTATAYGTYRPGEGLVSTDVARQGTWEGVGPDTGLVAFGAAWAALAGKNIDHVEVEMRRADPGNSPSSAVPIYMGVHGAATLGASVPSLTEVEQRASLLPGETATVDLPVSWGERWRDTGGGVGITHPSYSATIVLVTIRIDWSTP